MEELKTNFPSSHGIPSGSVRHWIIYYTGMHTQRNQKTLAIFADPLLIQLFLRGDKKP